MSKRPSLRDVALEVGGALRRHGITAVLTGGACATIRSRGRYVSADIDFVLEGSIRQDELDEAMAAIGFLRNRDRYRQDLPMESGRRRAGTL